jgi:hypothetical protein
MHKNFHKVRIIIIHFLKKFKLVLLPQINYKNKKLRVLQFRSEVLKKEHLLTNSKRKQKEKGDKRVKGVQIRLK